MNARIASTVWWFGYGWPGTKSMVWLKSPVSTAGLVRPSVMFWMNRTSAARASSDASRSSARWVL
jgi:hypothetical protein